MIRFRDIVEYIMFFESYYGFILLFYASSSWVPVLTSAFAANLKEQSASYSQIPFNVAKTLICTKWNS